MPPLPSCMDRSSCLEQSVIYNQEAALVFPSLPVTAPVPRTTNFHPAEPVAFWTFLGIRTVMKDPPQSKAKYQSLQFTCFFPLPSSNLVSTWGLAGEWGVLNPLLGGCFLFLFFFPYKDFIKDSLKLAQSKYPSSRA